jgi:hypothetical protein
VSGALPFAVRPIKGLRVHHSRRSVHALALPSRNRVRTIFRVTDYVHMVGPTARLGAKTLKISSFSRFIGNQNRTARKSEEFESSCRREAQFN